MYAGRSRILVHLLSVVFTSGLSFERKIVRTDLRRFLYFTFLPPLLGLGSLVGHQKHGIGSETRAVGGLAKYGITESPPGRSRRGLKFRRRPSKTRY